MEKMYCDYTGGHFEAWTYSDGSTVRFSMQSLVEIKQYAKKHKYKLILTDEAKLFEN